MSKFTRLPSGKWNLRVHDFYDSKGKKHTKSFTASTKAEIKQMVAEWKVNRIEMEHGSIRLSEAVEGYIDLKESVLSPSTVRSYKGIQKNHIDNKFIGRIRLDNLSSKDVQRWISELCDGHTPKTVRNAYGMLSAVLDVYAPDLKIKVTLPAKKKPDLYCPNSDDVMKVLETARDDDIKLVIAIMLASFIPARRGEICALEHSDISDNKITINKAMVHTPNNTWETKAPKTYGGYRVVEVPKFVTDLIPSGTGRIIDWTPDYLTEKFAKCIKKSGVQPFRFHDLRHYGASMLLTVMSERYVQDRGGWLTPNTMHSVYNNVIDMEKARQTKEAMQIFDKFAKVT